MAYYDCLILHFFLHICRSVKTHSMDITPSSANFVPFFNFVQRASCMGPSLNFPFCPASGFDCWLGNY